MNNKIGVFDSGIGGTTTLKEIINILPNEDYIFYADSKNNPYGEKKSKELYSIVSNIVEFLINKNVKLIVIACNTATTKCIKKLRQDYPQMIFVGTEPAIKVACDNNYKNTLVLATPGTIKSERIKQLIKRNKKTDENLYLISCDGLANAIERNDEIEIDKLLHLYLDKYKTYNIDAIVLGCTHYPIIKDKIQEFFKNATLIDGNIGVSKQVKIQLQNNNLLNNSNRKGTVEFLKTKK